MLAIVVSRADEASEHIGAQLRARTDWTEHLDESRPDAAGGGTVYRTEGAELRTFDDLHLHLDGAAAAQAAELADQGGDDPEARLRAACEHLFVTPGGERAGLHVAVMELLSHAPYNETLRDPLRELEGATLDALAGIIREGVEDGTFRGVDPEATAAFLLAAADGSTGFHVALGMDVGEDLRRGWSTYVDSLLADG